MIKTESETEESHHGRMRLKYFARKYHAVAGASPLAKPILNSKPTVLQSMMKT